MPKKLRVVYVGSGEEAVIKEIDGSLEGMQKAVGGYIEATYPFEEQVALVCNEEGKLGGYTPNRCLRFDNGAIYDVIFGDFFICGAPADSSEFESLTDEQCEKFRSLFEAPEMFVLDPDGNIAVIKLW